MGYLAIDENGLAVSGRWEADSIIDEGLTLVECPDDAGVGWTYSNGTWSSPITEDRDYAYLRSVAYPSIEEQLDMQYHDSVNGTTTWKDKIAQVKADNPKT